jgi:hypothetical protein
MISNKDLHTELTKIDDILKKLENKEKVAKEEVDWAILKSLILTTKLVHNLRTNSVAFMEKAGIARKTPLIDRGINGDRGIGSENKTEGIAKDKNGTKK